MINYYTIGQRVKEARKKKHLSQADLAEAVEKSTSYIILFMTKTTGRRINRLILRRFL